MARIERVRVVRRSAPGGPIHHIDTVTFLDKVMQPPGPPSNTHHVSGLPTAAVNQHDRVWIAHRSWPEVLHEHLAGCEGAIGYFLPLNARPEVTLIREVHRS